MDLDNGKRTGNRPPIKNVKPQGKRNFWFRSTPYALRCGQPASSRRSIGSAACGLSKRDHTADGGADNGSTVYRRRPTRFLFHNANSIAQLDKKSANLGTQKKSREWITDCTDAHRWQRDWDTD
jgi:hypothetical protein